VQKTRIIIVGGGPVGVVAALACAQHGYAVTLLEAEEEIDDKPRAATTHPSTLEMIAGVGLIDRFIQVGLVARYFQFWDKPARSKIVEFDHDVLRDETPYPFVVQTEQHKLAAMGIERLKTFADAEVRFATRATTVDQNGDSATVTVQGPDGSETLRGDYVIGADGGRSVIRKALDIAFEGFTWPERFLVLTTLDDFKNFYRVAATGIIWPIRMNGPTFSKSRVTTARDGGARCFRPGSKRAMKRRWATDPPIRVCNGYFHLPGATTSSIAIFTRCTSAWRRRFARGACFWPAIQRM